MKTTVGTALDTSNTSKTLYFILNACVLGDKCFIVGDSKFTSLVLLTQKTNGIKRPAMVNFYSEFEVYAKGSINSLIVLKRN